MLLLGALLSVAGVLAMAPSADAAHHLVRIRQVYAGGNTPTEFVVLQLTGANENQFTFGTTRVALYGAAGQTNSGTFMANPQNGQNQRTVLIATPSAETAFTVSADLQLSDDNGLEDGGGAVCFLSTYFASPPVDCVGWGTGTGATNPPSNMGTLEAAIPAGNMLERSIAGGCATLHEAPDDTNNSAADLAPVAIAPGSFTPRNNAAATVETPCTTTPPPGGGGTVPAAPAPAPKKKKCKKAKKRSGAAAKKKCKKKK